MLKIRIWSRRRKGWKGALSETRYSCDAISLPEAAAAALWRWIAMPAWTHRGAFESESWLKSTRGQDAGGSKICGAYEICVEDMSVYAGDGMRGGRWERPADDKHGGFAQGEDAQAPGRVTGRATRKLALPTSYAGD